MYRCRQLCDVKSYIKLQKSLRGVCSSVAYRCKCTTEPIWQRQKKSKNALFYRIEHHTEAGLSMQNHHAEARECRDYVRGIPDTNNMQSLAERKNENKKGIGCWLKSKSQLLTVVVNHPSPLKHQPEE